METPFLTFTGGNYANRIYAMGAKTRQCLYSISKVDLPNYFVYLLVMCVRRLESEEKSLCLEKPIVIMFTTY